MVFMEPVISLLQIKLQVCLGKDMKDLKIITCHLGNGASITAIENGKSVDTSMGFTPVDGLDYGNQNRRS